MPEISPLPEASSELAITPAEPLISARPSVRNCKWTAAIIVSGLLHAAVAAAFLIAPAGTFTSKESSQIEGADQSGDMVAGNGAEKQAVAGNPLPPDVTPVTLVTMPEPKPAKRVEAQPVQTTQTVEPTDDAKTDTPVTEALQPIADATQQPVATPEATEPVTSETAPADPLPEILTTDTSSKDEGVAAKSTTPSQTVELVEAAKADPAKTSATDPAAQKPGEQAAESSPSPVQDASREPQKPIFKPARPRSNPGSEGNSEADAKVGSANGKDRSATTASKGKKQVDIGNAAESNYRGKVISKLGRINRRVPQSVQAKAHNNAVVTFVVGPTGTIDDLRILESSGSQDFDQVVLGIVRKAAPFPPIPPDTGSKSLVFTGAIGPF